MKPTVRGRARRLWRIGAMLLASAVVLFIAGLPWILSLSFAQRQLGAAANRILAPSRVEFKSLALSWNHSTSISELVLRDAQGDRILVSSRAVFNWSLSQILFAQPTNASLLLEHGDLDIERSADGSVDLYETLKPVISEHPKKRLVIRIPDGSLRFRDPSFSEPVVASRAEMTIDLGMLYQPINWDIHLARGERLSKATWLDLKGQYSRSEIDKHGAHDLELSLKAEHWPWTLTSPFIESRGELNGAIHGTRRLGQISLAGDAIVNDVVAVGSILATDTFHVDHARARWKIGGDGKIWTVEQLEVTSPLGEVRAEGCVPPTPDRSAWLEGNLDLAALARQLPQTFHLRDDLRVERGAARLRADLASDAKGETQVCNVHGKVTDLIAHQGERTLRLLDPATLEAVIRKSATATTLERLEVQTPFLTMDGQGDLDRGIDVAATLDLAVFRDRFRDWIDLGGVVLAGKGKLTARYKRKGDEFEATASAEVRELRLDGLPMASRIDRDMVTIEAHASGPAAQSGWPSQWRNLSVLARTGPAELKILVASDPTTTSVGFSAHARSELDLNEHRTLLEAELSAKWAENGWSADRILLAITPKPAGDRHPDGVRIVRWRGRGRYDPATDVLSVESDPRSPGRPNEAETWVAGDQRIRVSGLRSWPASEIEATAKMDLASIGLLLAPDDEAWSGRLNALVRAHPEHDLWNLGIRLEVDEPARIARGAKRFQIDGDVRLGVKASYAPGLDRLELTELGLKAPYVALDGAGSVQNVTVRPELDLRGMLGLDWPAIEKQLTQRLEPGARIAGRPRPWRISGQLPAEMAIDRLGSLRGEIGTQIDSLDVFGMRLSQTPIVLRLEDGRFKVDPIDARLNAGVLHAEPELARMKDDSAWLRFSSDTRLEGAVINDEVSHRVLSFVAPVLDGATRVQGRVSFELSGAAFPLIGAPAEAAVAQGKLLFDDVRFMPGELAEQLLSVFRLESKPLVELRNPVLVRIADKRVYQNGLVVPVGNVASIALDGSVDFDRNLDMVARFGLNPLRSQVPVLSPLVETARFELPIRGTLAKPKIDGEALKERWKMFGSGLLQGSMEAGANGLQQLFQGLPKQPLRGLFPRSRINGTTAEERRRKKEDRRKDRLERKSELLKQSSPPE